MRIVPSWVGEMGFVQRSVREFDAVVRRFEGALPGGMQATFVRVAGRIPLRAAAFSRFGNGPEAVRTPTQFLATTVTVRAIDLASPAELDAVARNTLKSHHETIPETHGRTDLTNMTFETMRDMLEAAFYEPDRHCLVAVNEKGDIIGHRILKIKTDKDRRRCGEGWSLFIDPAYRKQGIASRLMRDADAWFRANHVSYIETGTHRDNVKMQRLYEKHGYRFVRYDHNGVNPLHIVRKDL